MYDKGRHRMPWPEARLLGNAVLLAMNQDATA